MQNTNSFDSESPSESLPVIPRMIDKPTLSAQTWLNSSVSESQRNVQFRVLSLAYFIHMGIVTSRNSMFSYLLELFDNPACYKVLTEALLPYVLILTFHPQGCRVIQRAITSLPDQQKFLIGSRLRGNVLACSRNANANHVLQRLVELFPADKLDFVFDELLEKCISVATNKYGCRIIQRIIENCSGDKAYEMMTVLTEHLHSIATHVFGNYVIQHLFDYGPPKFRRHILNMILSCVYEMARRKFSSNVVEHILVFGTYHERLELICVIFGIPFQLLLQTPWPTMDELPSLCYPNTNLDFILRDRYANYVVQQAIDASAMDLRQLLCVLLTPYFKKLEKISYGKHIISTISRSLASGNTDQSTAVRKWYEKRTRKRNNLAEQMIPSSVRITLTS